MENGEAQAGKGQGNSGKDPLGRPDRSNRPDLGLSVKVPDEIDIQRAREVLTSCAAGSAIRHGR